MNSALNSPASGVRARAMPNVSIILPTFNRTRLLRATVASVFAQTYADWELIIADDGSAAESRDYLRSITAAHVRTIWLTHTGNPARVRNAAIECARGRYLAFLDSDDLWAPTKLEKQLDALRSTTRAAWSYTTCGLIDGEGRPLTHERMRTTIARSGWIFEPLLRLELSIAMPTVVVERDLICAIGGFDERQAFAEWHDLCLRLAMQAEVVALPESLCSVRSHSEQYSADRIAAQASWMRLYEKMSRLAPAPHLRTLAARWRAETSLSLARLQSDGGNYGAALRTLCAALPFSWHFPRWWGGALRRVVRPAVPARLVASRRGMQSAKR